LGEFLPWLNLHTAKMSKINHAYIFSMLSLFFLGGLIGGCAASNRMKTQFERQMRYAQKVNMVVDMRMMFPGADHQESEVVLDYLVEDSDRQGNSTVKVTVRSIKASMRSLMISCSYDSSVPLPDSSSPDKNAKDHQKKYEASFSGIAGSSYRALVDKNGRVTQLTKVDDRIGKLSEKPIENGSFGGYQLALLFSPHHLREYVVPALLTACENQPPRVNESWVSYEPAESPRTSPVPFKKTCRIESIDEHSGDRVAKVTFTGEGAPGKELPAYAQPGNKQIKDEMEIVKVEHNSGDLTFSLSRGRLLKLHEKLITEVNIAGRYRRDQSLTQADKEKPKQKIYYLVDKTIEYLHN